MPCSFDIIRENWGTLERDSPTNVLAKKKKKTKDLLWHWSKEEVGNIVHKSKFF